MKKRLLYLASFFLLIIIGLWLTGNNHIYKALYYNFADIDDYKIFPNRTIKASNEPQPWLISKRYNKKTLNPEFEKLHDSLKTISFLVIKDDSIIYERYWDDYGIGSKSNSFSMAKSYISALIGIAIKEGHISNVKDPIGKYLESFSTGGKEKITIEHVLMMSSGLNWDEGYSSPFSITTKGYYGTDLPILINQLEAAEPSGKNWSYKSGDTQVLAMVLEKATKKTISAYAQEKLWQPLCFEQDALWSLDHENGIEKAYCCINTDARDFARIIKLYMNQGKWNNQQIIDADYVKQSISANNLNYNNGKCDFYGYQWWLIPNYKDCNIFYARGILGQFAIAIPEKNIIIVRLGHERGEKAQNSMHQNMTFEMIDEVLSW